MTYKNECKIDKEIRVVEIFLAEDKLADLDWYISEQLLLKFFVSFGLRMNMFERYFPHLSGELMRRNVLL